MAFWNREERLPQVIDTYGPYQDVRGQLDEAYNTAQNRAAQRINQMYANVGMSPRGAPATAARARSVTDIENQRAQLGYQSYYDWLRGKQLARPEILPSGASTLAAPFISGIGQAAGPGIVAGATKALGQGWNYLTGSGGGDYVPNISASSYDYAGAPAFGEGGYGEYVNPYADISPSTFADISGAFSPAYTEVPWADIAPDFSSAFDVGGW